MHELSRSEMLAIEGGGGNDDQGAAFVAGQAYFALIILLVLSLNAALKPAPQPVNVTVVAPEPV